VAAVHALERLGGDLDRLTVPGHAAQRVEVEIDAGADHHRHGPNRSAGCRRRAGGLR
jgi:hypothetical protein